MEAVYWEEYSLLYMQAFFESFVLQFLPMFAHLIHSNLMSTTNLYKSLSKNIDLYCCSHMRIKKCTFSARGCIWCLFQIDLPVSSVRNHGYNQCLWHPKMYLPEV